MSKILENMCKEFEVKSMIESLKKFDFSDERIIQSVSKECKVSEEYVKELLKNIP